MAVFLGQNGHVELRRDASQQALTTTLDPDDVNVDRKRFSVDSAEGSLITGDQVTISTTDGSPLELVAGHVDSDGVYYSDWRGYIHIDDAGGLRLYTSFSSALAGGQNDALTLVKPTESAPIFIQNRDKDFNCLAKVSGFELTTNRDQVQTDVLGDEFRSYYEAGLISGQGTLECLWEHKRGPCEETGPGNVEFPSYLARLILRLKQGSDFYGRFYVYAVVGEPSIWYECKCMVTNHALSVEPTQIVRTQVQFVATGPITLHQGEPPFYLLQEDSSLLLQEDGSALRLEESD
jgi:hypothetical protein